MRRAAVLGAGGMGTALAILLEKAGVSVGIWTRDPVRAEAMAASRENARHLPGVPLPSSIAVSASIAEITRDAELVVAAIPTSFLRMSMQALADHIPADATILSVVKGIENQTFLRPSQILEQVLGPRRIVALSGPSHAEEIARGLPASVVVSGCDQAATEHIRDLLCRGHFRVYSSEDMLGVELAGALKNILGVAAGVCDGLEFGDNAKAALLTRGLVEITRLGVALGARFETFQGLAGLGDVVTTCYSRFGRNRAVGERIGRGERLEDILAGMVDVAEGVSTTRATVPLAAARGVSMPITSELHQILFQAKPPRQAVVDLMDRTPKYEWRP